MESILKLIYKSIFITIDTVAYVLIIVNRWSHELRGFKLILLKGLYIILFRPIF